MLPPLSSHTRELNGNSKDSLHFRHSALFALSIHHSGVLSMIAYQIRFVIIVQMYRVNSATRLLTVLLAGSALGLAPFFSSARSPRALRLPRWRALFVWRAQLRPRARQINGRAPFRVSRVTSNYENNKTKNTLHKQSWSDAKLELTLLRTVRRAARQLECNFYLAIANDIVLELARSKSTAKARRATTLFDSSHWPCALRCGSRSLAKPLLALIKRRRTACNNNNNNE